MNNLPRGTVVLDNVSKRYRLGSFGTLRGTLAALTARNRDRDDPRELWALKDVSFRVEPGSSLGLIGPNGAGKTTALKLLSSITQPTSGHLHISGRASSLIELGAGFHPELSGRENIFLNGAILGLSRREIERKLDEIIAFSELERFIDTPVKRYSSGMYVRLGFAVAAHVEPEILLVDEVLAVGDASFRQKCMARMEALRSGGTTLVFVSHNMHQVRRLCRQALLLIDGKPMFLGDARDAISAYEESAHSTGQEGSQRRWSSEDGQADVVITEVTLLGIGDGPAGGYRHDQQVQLRIRYRAHSPMVYAIVKVRLLSSDGKVCALAASHHAWNHSWTLANDGVISVFFEPIQLATGTYVAEVRIADSTDTVLLASGQSSRFWVQGPAMMHEPDQGVYVPNVVWSHTDGRI